MEEEGERGRGEGERDGERETRREREREARMKGQTMEGGKGVDQKDVLSFSTSLPVMW